MSTKSKKFDPAYPTLIYNEYSGEPNGHFEGVTLLDAFAMSVLNGLYASVPDRATKDSPEYWADTAYDIAEAMYAEKMKRQYKK